MGRMLGAFAEDEDFDRPDLNQCPDCKCYFDGDFCPLCGKECPENMRAGNRPAVKPKRKKRTSSSGMYLSWYHMWWFIGLMLFLFPVVGIILLLTSPHKTAHKVLLVILGIVFMIVSYIGFGNIISNITELWDKPVDDTITMEEYIDRCEDISAEQFYRSIDNYEDKFVCVKLRVVEKVTYVDSFYNDKDYICYLCEAEDGSDYKIVVRDCLLSNRQRFVVGDIITVYGEGAGDCEVYDSEYNYTTAPCINMAYVDFERN